MWVSKEVLANLRQPNEASSIEKCSHVLQAVQIVPGTAGSPFVQCFSIIVVYKGT